MAKFFSNIWTKIKSLFKRPNDQKFSPLFLILGIFLTIYAISMLAVLFWACYTSLKEPLIAFTEDAIWFPKQIYWGNYVTVFSKFAVKTTTTGENVDFWRMLLYSVLYAVGNALCRSCVLFIVAYAAARFKFAVGKIIYGIVIVGMILPIVGAQPSMIAVARQLGIYDSIPGMYLQKANFMGMHFLIFHATLSAFPKDFDEAAQIDGAGNLSVMLRIMWPLCMTTFATILLLNFISEWNDYNTPMMFLPTFPTISYGLWSFNNGTGGDGNSTAYTPVKVAACFLAALPTLLLFTIFHDRLLTNLSIGGVKE